MIRRRSFITLLGGAAVAWPLAARAQQGDRMRRIGVLMTLASDDPEAQVRNAAFLQGLQEHGWSVGRNATIEYRWGAGDADLYRRYAAELVALMPDFVLATGTTAAANFRRLSGTLPIVFVSATDPVGAGLVTNLARPGGNVTGFAQPEYGLGAKLMELLKQIAPRVTRVAVLRNSDLTSGPSQLAAIQSVAPLFGVELSPVGVSDVDEIERGITAFARGSNDGLIVTNSAAAATHRNLIIALAAHHKLPAVYAGRLFVASGGLASYWIEGVEPYRLAAGYVDRILKGEKPADLPVQNPVKYELVINVKTAKALGLDIPATVYARADEVIE
jgi:putative ABC transport system substrate-binding protein